MKYPWDYEMLPERAFQPVCRRMTLEGKGGGSAPAPDPNIAIAAMTNAQTAQQALTFSEQAYNNNLPQQQKAADIANQVSQQQLAASQQNQANAQTQWNQYQTNFAPIDAQVAADATGIDSQANLDVASGNAATQVQAQSDNSNAQLQRQQESMGVNPNSGRAQALASEGALTTAASKANAATTTAQNLHAQGISLRAGAANFGAGMPNTVATAYGTALNNGNSSVGNSIAPINTANAMTAQAMSGYNSAINGMQSSGSLSLGSYNAQLGAYNAQQQASASSSAGIGNMVGTIGAAATPYIAAAMMSSKKIKDQKSKIDHADTLAKVKKLPVENWRYKKGISDSGQHVGAYAEDMQKSFGDRVAPGGKAIDMISQGGITLSAVKGLADQVDKLSGKMAQLSAARGIKGK